MATETTTTTAAMADSSDECRDADNPILAAALEYASYGWHVIPVRARTKSPWFSEWQTKVSCDPVVIRGWWSRWPESNVGVQLGEKSGIIDVECDSMEEEQDYLALFSNNPPVTPTFGSSRGKHRLFKGRLDLPARAVVKIGRICVRIGGGAKGSQSVFPPSIHPSGAQYRWLVTPEDCPPPPLPDEIFARMWNLAGEAQIEIPAAEAKPLEYWEGVSAGVSEGQRNEKAAELCGMVLRSIDVTNNSQIAVQWELIEAWNARNKPPLDQKELRKTFESILQRERRRRATEDHLEETMLQGQGVVNPVTGKTTVEQWRMVIVTSQPPRYKIFSPLWTGPIEVSASQLTSVQRMRVAVVDQKNVWLPRGFGRMWMGTKDKPPLARVLLESADKESASEEVNRNYAIADQLYAILTTYPKVMQDGDEFDSRGLPCLMQDGSCVFQFVQIWRPMIRSEDKVNRHELSVILKELGAESYFPKIAGKTYRRTKIPPSGMGMLRAMVICEEKAKGV